MKYLQSKVLWMAVSAFALAAHPSDAATVTFQPLTTNIGVGDTTQIDIIGNDFEELAGGQIDLSFDAGILNIQSVTVASQWDFEPDPGSETGPGMWTGIGFDVFVNPPASGNDIPIASLQVQGTSAGQGNISIAGTSQFFSTTEQIFPDFEMATVSVDGDGPALAEAMINNPNVDLGRFRVGDPATPEPVSISNVAEAGSQNLGAAADGTTGGVIASGSFDGLPPGETNDGDITVSIDTSSAGEKSGDATIDFTSQDGDSTALPSQDVMVSGTVNALANPLFQQAGGDGSLSGGGTEYVLDFGSVLEGSDETLTAELSLLNQADQPADNLDGEFDLSQIGLFSVSGFGPVEGLAPGEDLSGLMVMWMTLGLAPGSYEGSIVFDPVSVFPGLEDVALDDISIRLVGEIRVIPLPGAFYLFGTALAALFGAGVRRNRRA